MTLSPSAEVIAPPDADRARLAFAALAAEAGALPQHALLRPSMDLPYCVVRVLALLREWRRPETFARLSGVPTAKFDPTTFARAETCANALWHAHGERLCAGALTTKRKVDARVGREAIALRRRMMAATRYHLGDAHEIGGALRAVRGKRGWTDLAMDLTHLAAIFEAHADRLPTTPDPRYAPDDVTKARALVHRLQRDLAARVSRVNPWSDTVARVFTLLAWAYEDARRTVAWAWRDTKPEREFPRLRQLRRPTRGAAGPRAAAT